MSEEEKNKIKNEIYTILNNFEEPRIKVILSHLLQLIHDSKLIERNQINENSLNIMFKNHSTFYSNSSSNSNSMSNSFKKSSDTEQIYGKVSTNSEEEIQSVPSTQENTLTKEEEEYATEILNILKENKQYQGRLRKEILNELLEEYSYK